MKAGNQTLLKKNNQTAIIEYIIKHGPTSRAGLSQALKISKPTVSANVLELLELKLLKEIGYRESEIGKRPMLVDFNKDYKYVLALDFISFINRGKVSVAVCNLYCEPIFIDDIPLSFDFNADEIRQIPDKVEALCLENEIDPDEIGKLVLTAPTVKFDEGHIRFECKSGESINLAEVFAKKFPGKIAVKNDVNLAALGEKYFGMGKDVKNLLFVWAGLAVGGGIILNGELYEGYDRTGGEIAYSYLYNECTGEYCHIKDIFNMKGVQAYIDAHRKEAAKSIIAEQLLSGNYYLDMMSEAAVNGDEFCGEFARFAGRSMGMLISNFAYTMNLEMVIVGGEYSNFGPLFLNEIRSIMAKIPLQVATVTTPFYTNSAMYGAFRFGADSIISKLI